MGWPEAVVYTALIIMTGLVFISLAGGSDDDDDEEGDDA